MHSSGEKYHKPPNNMYKNAKATTKQAEEYILEIAQVMEAWCTRTVDVTWKLEPSQPLTGTAIPFY
jgi:hypothetical protein